MEKDLNLFLKKERRLKKAFKVITALSILYNGCLESTLHIWQYDIAVTPISISLVSEYIIEGICIVYLYISLVKIMNYSLYYEF